jgi:hypothetical protein
MTARSQRPQWSAAAGSARSSTGCAARGTKIVGEEGGAAQVGWVHGAGMTDRGRPRHPGLEEPRCGRRAASARPTRSRARVLVNFLKQPRLTEQISKKLNRSGPSSE